jgi:hypothetical protein
LWRFAPVAPSRNPADAGTLFIQRNGNLKEWNMRRFFLSAALLAGFAAIGALMPSQANAMTISTPAALAQAGGGTSVTEAAYACRRWFAWGRWHRSCAWRAPYRAYGYYGYRRPYAYYGYRHRYYHRRYW